jgi:hypothetical protein
VAVTEGGMTKWIEVSVELLEELGHWSAPLQVMITRDDDGRLEMVFREPVGEK